MDVAAITDLRPHRVTLSLAFLADDMNAFPPVTPRDRQFVQFEHANKPANRARPHATRKER